MRIVCIIVSICSLFSCGTDMQKYPGYSYHTSGYYYQLHSFADGFAKARVTDFVTATITFSSITHDSIVVSEKCIVQVAPQDSACLPFLLEGVKQGDSISYIIPNTKCVRDILPQEFADLFSDYNEIKLVAKIHSVTDAVSYAQKQKEYELWVKNKQEFEQEILRKYLSKQKYSYEYIEPGIYKFIIKKGSGVKPKSGELISISYQGSLLNGDIVNHFTSMEFVLGTQWQVIEGIERALYTMSFGERALIIIPSIFAFGESGTSDKSILPFTTLRYDLELLD